MTVKLAWSLSSLVLASVAPSPWSGLLVCAAFALFGGLAAQLRAWVYGEVTMVQAAVELPFAVIAGMVVHAAGEHWDYSLLVQLVAAILAGMAGRPLLLKLQTAVWTAVAREVRKHDKD